MATIWKMIVSVVTVVCIGMGPAIRVRADDVDDLIAQVQSSERKVRDEAVRALGNSEDDRAVEPLMTALQDPVAAVRRTAAYALNRFDDLRSIAAHIAALQDSDDEVRRYAVDALDDFDEEPPMRW